MTSAFLTFQPSYRCDLPCHGPILDSLYGLMNGAVFKGEGRMRSVDGSAARKLEFGQTTTAVRVRRPRSFRRLGLLHGPNKYELLERRRRAAQINARHALDLIDAMETPAEKR